MVEPEIVNVDDDVKEIKISPQRIMLFGVLAIIICCGIISFEMFKLGMHKACTNTGGKLTDANVCYFGNNTPYNPYVYTPAYPTEKFNLTFQTP